MKTMAIWTIMFLFFMGAVFAVGQGDDTGQPDGTPGDDKRLANGTGQDTDSGNNDDTTSGTPQGTQVQNQVKAQTMEELQLKIQERTKAMTQEMDGMSEKAQKVSQAQNEVRNTVQTLLEMEDLVGGIGPQVSEVARQFDNSAKSTNTLEEKIAGKSGVARFFTGGDKEAGEALKAEAAKNQEKIQELKQLQEQCDCDQEVKDMLQEQIKTMEKEQVRLNDLAEKESKSKGMFGWMWK